MADTDRTPVGAMLGLVRGTPDEQLAYVVDTMRSMSRQTDPQQMVRDYGDRVRRMLDIDCSVSLSRRDVSRPRVTVTRSSLSDPSAANPWTHKHLLPVLDGGVLSDLIWGDVPAVVNDLRVPESDPAFPYLRDMRSLVAIPLYDQGQSLNMVVLARTTPNGSTPDTCPSTWMSNLFGRATFNLVLSQEVRRAYDTIDRDLARVAAIQRSLLPEALPAIPTLDVAAHYQTSRRAGGDYYDFLPLPGGRWGILSADVSGHSTPAAVIMAIVHSIVAHAPTVVDDPPGRLLSFVNDRLVAPVHDRHRHVRHRLLRHLRPDRPVAHLRLGRPSAAAAPPPAVARRAIARRVVRPPPGHRCRGTLPVRHRRPRPRRHAAGLHRRPDRGPQPAATSSKPTACRAPFWPPTAPPPT